MHLPGVVSCTQRWPTNPLFAILSTRTPLVRDSVISKNVALLSANRHRHPVLGYLVPTLLHSGKSTRRTLRPDLLVGPLDVRRIRSRFSSKKRISSLGLGRTPPHATLYARGVTLRTTARSDPSHPWPLPYCSTIQPTSLETEPLSTNRATT